VGSDRARVAACNVVAGGGPGAGLGARGRCQRWARAGQLRGRGRGGSGRRSGGGAKRGTPEHWLQRQEVRGRGVALPPPCAAYCARPRVLPARSSPFCPAHELDRVRGPAVRSKSRWRSATQGAKTTSASGATHLLGTQRGRSSCARATRAPLSTATSCWGARVRRGGPCGCCPNAGFPWMRTLSRRTLR
jgi:hypothetical protein